MENKYTLEQFANGEHNPNNIPGVTEYAIQVLAQAILNLMPKPEVPTEALAEVPAEAPAPEIQETEPEAE